MAALTGSVAIVGLGVIGGSLAKALKAAGVPVRAYSPQRAEREQARADGIAVEDALGAALVRDSSVIVLAVPIDRIAALASELRRHAPTGCVMTHTGSLQRAEALGITEDDAKIIGTHPIAGSASTGYDHSHADLFRGAAVSGEAGAGAPARQVIEELWRAVGSASVTWRSADAHDRLMSWVSHLPQLASIALGLAMSRADVDPRTGGSGLRDTTRLAASSLLMWRPILDSGPSDTLDALRALEQAVGEIRSALETGDQELLSEMWSVARAWRTGAERDDAR